MATCSLDGELPPCSVMLYHNDEESREAVHDLAYHDFSSFGERVDFLYVECQDREWIPWEPKG